MKTFLAFFALLPFLGFSQQPSKKTFSIPKAATVSPSLIVEDFNPTLRNIEAPFPGGESARNYLQELREKQSASFHPGRIARPDFKTAFANMPWVGKEIDGNRVYEGLPNDNDLAISNGDKIVSVINSNIFTYDLLTDTITSAVSLDAFSSILGITGSKFDPKLRYDPRADRFVMVFLNGFTDTTSKIIVAFSASNDPAGNWNLYSFPGNPLNDSTWTDYPIIGLSKTELFITGNLLIPGMSWQTGFKQSIIWQMKLSDGYSGGTMTSQLWSDIRFNGGPIRNLCPVQGGSNTTGPNIYFLSNRNFAPSTDSIFILEITDTINSPNDTLRVDLKHADNPYGFPPLAKQRLNAYLETNDARMLGAFIENGKIQFVSNTVNPDTNRACVYHGVISDLAGARTIHADYIKTDTLDFGYPNLSYAGIGASDNSSVISFNYTGSSTNPGFAAAFYNGPSSYSDHIRIKSGLNYINLQTGAIKRWGDYSGAQRKYNMPGVVWACGTYGRVNRSYGTWITEIFNPEVFVGTPVTIEEKQELLIFPNPVGEQFSVEFNLKEASNTEISLVDINGKLVHIFLRDRVKPGQNIFTFTANSLEAGIYFVKVRTGENETMSQKIIVNK